MNSDSRNSQQHYRKTSGSSIDNKNDSSQQSCDRNLKKNRSSRRMCSIKKVLLKISKYSPENTCARVSFK